MANTQGGVSGQGAIDSLQYGYDLNGIEAYLRTIKNHALYAAQKEVTNYNNIAATCREYWFGKARDNFLANLEADSKHCSDQFEMLYNVLESEINSLGAAMSNWDEQLIKNEGGNP